MSKGSAKDAAMPDSAGSAELDPMARIAAALEVLPSLLDGQAKLVSNIEVLMRSVEKQKEETSALNARIADLTERIQTLEEEKTDAPQATAAGTQDEAAGDGEKPAKFMRGAAGKAHLSLPRHQCFLRARGRRRNRHGHPHHPPAATARLRRSLPSFGWPA